MLKFFPYEMKGHLKVTDEDAADFLQSQFSNELRPFKPGASTYGLWLDVKGKIVADSWVCCEGPESFHIYSEHCAGERIAEKLERHIIADDVEIEILPAVPALAVLGDEEVAAPAGEDGIVAVLPGRRSLKTSREFLFDTVDRRDAFVREEASEIVTENQIQKMRINASIPQVPIEAGPGDLPGEVGLDEDAVAYDKGCFLGQEVVARMRNVGKATRALYLVRGEGDPPVCPLELRNEEGKTIGELRSAYLDGDDWIGVAILKVRYAAAELQLNSDAGVVGVKSAFNKRDKERGGE